MGGGGGGGVTRHARQHKLSPTLTPHYCTNKVKKSIHHADESVSVPQRARFLRTCAHLGGARHSETVQFSLAFIYPGEKLPMSV